MGSDQGSNGGLRLLVALFSCAIVALGAHELHLMYGGDEMSGESASQSILQELHGDEGIRASVKPEAFEKAAAANEEDPGLRARLKQFLNSIL